MKVLFALLLALFCMCYAQTCSNSAPLCSDLTCGVSLPTITPNNVACSLCSKAHYGAAFTHCDPSTSKKSLYYFWKPPATCIINGNSPVTALPAPIANIPCGLNCVSGQYFNTSTVSCPTCPAGSISQNSELIIEDWFDFPRQFSTRCEIAYAYQKCVQSWRTYGDYVATSENEVGIRNVLEMTASIVKPGFISIDYMTVLDSALEYEEMPGFWVNDKLILRLNMSTSYTTFTYPLSSAGSYKFGFTNRKLYPLRNNEVRIRRVELFGTSDLDTECIVCPPGTYSKDNKVCKACPRNTFASSSGSASCTPCPAFHISGLQSTSCQLRPEFACNVTDYFYTYEPCNGGITRATAHWIQPQLCDSAHPLSVRLPEDHLLPCAELVCTNNQVMASDGTCNYCQRGYYVSTNITGAQCTPCPAGSGTYNQFTISHFTQSAVSSIMETGCVNCRTAVGWRMAGGYMDTGGNYSLSPRQPTVYAEIPVTVQRIGASASIIAALSCPPGAYLIVELTKPLKKIRVDCTGCQSAAFGLDVLHSAKFVNITIDFSASSGVPLITPHSSSLRIEYYPFVAASAYDLPDSCNRVAVSQIYLTGTNYGGASTCGACPAGTASVSNCEICPEGTFADTATGNCTICPENTYSLAKSPACFACGEGRISAPGSTVCGWRDGSATFNTRVEGIARSLVWKNTAETTHKFPYPVAATTEQIYLNLAQINHPVCGYSMICAQATAADPYVKVGETAGVATIATESLYGAQLDVLSVKVCPVGGFLNSTVRLLCSLSASTPKVTATKRLSGCGYDVDITTVEVCPPCVEDDYFLFKENCDTATGQQFQRWVKKPGAAHVCLNEIKDLKNVTYVPCDTNIEVAFPIWSVFLGIILAILVICLVVGVIVAIGYVSVRYQLLNSKYQSRIQNQETGSK